MGTTWTPWHLILAVLLGQRAPGDRDIQSEVPLTADALRVDFVFILQANTSGRPAGTLKKLWGLLPKQAICEFKSAGRPYRRFNFDRLLAYLTTYISDEIAKVGNRSDLGGVLLVVKRTKTLDEDVRAYGLRWQDLGDGYWQLEGSPFKLFVVELEVVADAEEDDVLRFLSRQEPRTVEGKRWLAKQLGSEEIQMKMHEMEGFDEVLQTLLQSLPPEQVLSAYAPEQVLSAYAPEQRLAGLAPEQRLAGLAPEQRLEGLAPDQVVLTLPDDVLKALSDSYIDALPEPTRTTIRKRIGR